MGWMALLFAFGVLADDLHLASEHRAVEVPIIGKVRDLQVGGYWAKNYVDTLKRTRSPMQAMEMSGPLVWTRLQKTAEKTEISFIDMGGVAGIVQFDLEDRLLSRKKGSRWLEYFEVVDRNTFYVKIVDQIGAFGSAKKNLENTYFYWPQQELDAKVISRYSLAGSYEDQKGRTYLITEDGECIFPGRRFRYVVAYGGTAGWDTFAEVGPEDVHRPGIDLEYAFKWIAGKLHIYQTRQTIAGTIEVEAEPYLILQEVGKKGQKSKKGDAHEPPLSQPFTSRQ